MSKWLQVPIRCWYILIFVLIFASPSVALARNGTDVSTPPSEQVTSASQRSHGSSSVTPAADIECDSTAFAYQIYDATWSFGGRTDCTGVMPNIHVDSQLYVWVDFEQAWEEAVAPTSNDCPSTSFCSAADTEDLYPGLYRVINIHTMTFPAGYYPNPQQTSTGMEFTVGS